MWPSYPSLTFPNHWSIVTGLYPEHHGIVANSFFDPTRTPEQGQRYSYTDPKTSGDGSWYGGTPLWVLAEKQGMRAACLFWPGSEAEIQGKRPSYYLHYDDKLDDRKRVDQVIAWLSLPPEQRPHFITLYYSNVDHEGHAHGPESDEVRAAVHHVDDMIGDLQAGLEKLNLPIDLVVLADHGMVTLNGIPVNLSQFADLTDVKTEGSLLYAKDDAAAQKLYEQFQANPDPRFKVYRRLDVPTGLHYEANVREGDPVLVPEGPYTLRIKPPAEGSTTGSTLRGGHGFAPRNMPEMKAIFYAQGPDIAPNVALPTFTNVSVYPFIARLLGLDAPKVDGRINVLLPALVQSMRPSGPEGMVNTQPKLIYHAEAEFSEQARKKKISGDVLVALTVDENGMPQNVHVVHGVGYGLDEKAIEAIKKYRFRPATENGKPVATEIEVMVNFHILGSPDR
jgi:alkaline phosphatase D